jgi:acetylornithine/succinyldiaminopimelate/putrescine aminotransferase
MSSLRELYFRHMGLPSGHPLAIEVTHAEGIYFYDVKGKRYTDLVSGVAVSNVGHRHPRVVEAIRDQLDKYLHLMVYGEYVLSPQVKLAKALAEQLPAGLNSVFFVNSGSEAIEGAIKLAKRHTGRPGIAAFKNAYHGGTAGALSILGNEQLKNAFRPLLPAVSLLDFNDEDSLEMINSQTACVVVECIQAEAGIILPRRGFIKKIRDRCHETGALMVVDDIQMGFGRTGRLFSFEHHGIIPDILCLAKGMGGGMPAGAFIAPASLMKKLSHQPELGHITTFGGHPLCCAAALANLEVITTEKLHHHANHKGQAFFDHLSPHPAVKEIRFAGLMMAVELHSKEMTNRLCELFPEHGLVTDRFLFRPTAFRIAPPLIITGSEIDETAETIIHCLDKL